MSEFGLQLRDIHLPPEPGWWPPAPGWWLLALGLILALLAVVLLLRRWQRRRQRRQQLDTLCDFVWDNYLSHRSGSRLAEECSLLLRRAAIARFPRQDVASLHGEAWLAFLDRQLGGQEFVAGVGAVLAEAAWRPIEPQDPHALMRLTRRWVAKQGMAADV